MAENGCRIHEMRKSDVAKSQTSETVLYIYVCNSRISVSDNEIWQTNVHSYQL